MRLKKVPIRIRYVHSPLPEAKAAKKRIERELMNTLAHAFIILLAIALVRIAPMTAAELANESLLALPPKNYKIGFHANSDGASTTEMFPATESVTNWSEMLVLQTFQGMSSVPPETFEAELINRWRAGCPDATSFRIARGFENGYSFVLTLIVCSSNKESNKPEFVWFKAIRGIQAFHLVQRVSRFAPSREQVVDWMKYLREVRICDSALQGSACPKSE
jgi:hypothetical protein